MSVHVFTLEQLSEAAPPPSDADWNDEGVVILRDFIPGELLDAYREEWWAVNGRGDQRLGLATWREQPFTLDADEPGGWEDCTPYMRHEALHRLCCDGFLGEWLAALAGEPMGVHLNLTGWVTTARNYHQDTYLNPPGVDDYYAAVWFALDDVHPASGVFQYVPGSHRWHVLKRDKICRYVDPLDPQWPKHTEDFLTPLVEDEIEERGARVVSYVPKRGDVLIWHSRLYHRGSRAAIEGTYRPALIAHYSGIHHRPDFPKAIQHEAGGWYFPIQESVPVR